MRKVRDIGVFSLSISNITLAELYFGAYCSKKTEENLKRIELFKKNMTIYPDNDISAKVFGRFKSKLRAKGNIIEDFDILIASISFANNCVLVTNNTSHFQRIEVITIENWLL